MAKIENGVIILEDKVPRTIDPRDEGVRYCETTGQEVFIPAHIVIRMYELYKWQWERSHPKDSFSVHCNKVIGDSFDRASQPRN
jgi:hypothetical protein